MKLCDFLRSSDGPAVREAIEMDKRVYYIKGTFMWRHTALLFSTRAISSSNREELNIPISPCVWNLNFYDYYFITKKEKS